MPQPSEQAILGRDLLMMLAKALNIEETKVRRIVLDVRFDAAVVAYIEQFGTRKLIDINWSGNLQDTKIKFEDDHA